jgi:hypothetical protein
MDQEVFAIECMCKQHGLLPPDVRRNHAAECRYPRDPLNVDVIDNKRFTSQEREEIQIAINEINHYTDMHINKSMEAI